LVIVDAQPDLINALPVELREPFLKHLKELLSAARRANWLVVFSGLRFPSGYEGVKPRHRVFGALQRLNQKQGDKTVHWLMEGFEGSNIHPELAPAEEEPVVWRRQLRPTEELLAPLRAKKITRIVLAGMKTAQGLLATCEAIADESIVQYIVRECVADDQVERGEAVLAHVLNQYADIMGWKEFQEQISQEMMMDMFVAHKIAQQQKAGLTGLD